LQSHKKELQARAAYREWYSYSAPRSLLQHDSAMIAVPLLANRGLASLIPASSRSKLCPMASGGFTVTLGGKCGYDPHFVLGVLNSKVLFWYLEQLSNVFRGGWITCTKQYFGSLPIKRIDLRGKAGRAQHDEVVEIVQLLVANVVQTATAKTDQKKDFLTRENEQLEARLDDAVAKVYGLTDRDRQLISDGGEARAAFGKKAMQKP
jgi:adenine-specific DNA-methyltransferase